MATFTSFQNILPDPNNTIGSAGQVAGTAGPGFASVSLISKQPTIKDKTNSGRLLARAIASHNWEVAIKYNPMVRADFERIYTFLLHRQGGINPFFVSLPQYRVPQSSTFASYAASNNLEATGTILAGATSALIAKSGYSNTTNGTPSPGDLFTIDGANSNHTKTYMVTRVETTADYNTGEAQPSSTQVRIHFTPGMAKQVSAADDFIFSNPLIKVIAKDTQNYSLNTNNLYSYSLNLEEVQ
jgi:hypothetical protein